MDFPIMSTPTSPSQPENGTVYSLEILSELTGVSTQTILQYQEHGLIRTGSGDESRFTDETLRLLRRIEHLRELCEPNLTGLKMLTLLLDEVEALRRELRARRW
jgi:DNA-binding transcriptional MerR regulator